MKKNYSFYIVILTMVCFNIQSSIAQSTELFEDETLGATTFSDNGQTFVIASTSTDTYDMNVDSNGGWDAVMSVPDNNFIDNFGSEDANNESSFRIATNDATEFIMSSLYLFCANTTFTNPTTGTLTINGIKNGMVAFTITKSTGFADIETFNPNSGYTFIDFATEGSSDFSQVPIDEVEFISDGDIDYMGLDSFTWDFASTLSINGNKPLNQTLSIYPNPATNVIKVANLRTSQNFEIFNVLGNRISKGIVAQDESIDIQNFSNGLYIIRLDNGNSFKFLKK